jgi:hypothetical protein
MVAQTKHYFCVLVIATGFACNSPVWSAESAQAMLGKISAYENRFFFHQYPSDPGEKRLERLELLIFGTTQEGSLEERLARLGKAIVERDNQSSSKTTEIRPQSPAAAPSVNKSSDQYPILNTFEWRVFKKTYPGESLDERLNRLETKIFGQSSPAISYFDRVDRLKKTLGIGGVTEIPKGRMGPTSKAKPRGQWGGELPDITPGFPEFGQSNDMFGPLSDIMRQMQKQMQDLSKLPPGTYEIDPQTGEFVEKDTGKRVEPSTPFVVPSLPQQAPKKTTPVPPPYNDPNSI